MTRGAAPPLPPGTSTDGAPVRRFDCLDLPPEPWANGGGVTRTVARGSITGHGGYADWRVSLATLGASAKFSLFAGFDRTLLPVDEGVVELHSEDGPLTARRGQPVHFSGDLPVWSTLPAAPLNGLNVLNVMTRRGACGASVGVVSGVSRIACAPVQLLIGLSGRWTVRGAGPGVAPLGPLQGLVIEAPRTSLDLLPVDAGSELVSIAIAPAAF